METPEEGRWQWCAALNSQTNLWCFSPSPRLRMGLKACMHGPGPSQLVGLSLSFTLPVPVASRRGLLSGPWTFHIFTFAPSFLGLPPPRCLCPSSGPTFPGILVVDALEPRSNQLLCFLSFKMPETTAWDGDKLLNGYINCKKIPRFHPEILMLKTKWVRFLVCQSSFSFLFQYPLSFLHFPKGQGVGKILTFNSAHSILGKWLKIYLSS